MTQSALNHSQVFEVRRNVLLLQNGLHHGEPTGRSLEVQNGRAVAVGVHHQLSVQRFSDPKSIQGNRFPKQGQLPWHGWSDDGSVSLGGILKVRDLAGHRSGTHPGSCTGTKDHSGHGFGDGHGRLTHGLQVGPILSPFGGEPSSIANTMFLKNEGSVACAVSLHKRRLKGLKVGRGGVFGTDAWRFHAPIDAQSGIVPMQAPFRFGTVQ